MIVTSQTIRTGPNQAVGVWAIALALLGLLAAALTAAFSPAAAVLAAGLLMLMGGLLWRFPPPGPALGWANSVTLTRALLMAALALWLVDWPASTAAVWAMTALAGVILALDGVDGFLARRFDECSDWGARFDMEVDAALILVLAVLAAQTGKAGVWVLALGLIRYAFVAGGTFLPWLRAALPESLRRKTVCVLQVVVLTALLAPPLVSPLSDLAALAALAALVWSFAVDILWLWRNRHEPRGAS